MCVGGCVRHLPEVKGQVAAVETQENKQTREEAKVESTTPAAATVCVCVWGGGGDE